MEKSSLILLVGLVAAAGLALFYTESTSHKETAAHDTPSPEVEDTAQEPLPANHPPIASAGKAMGMGNMGPVDNDDAPAVEWKTPEAWKLAPNPNGMRIATYKISGDTELVVSRAGGDVAGNIARWQGQFEGSPAGQRSDKTVHDMKVTTVQIDGTYTNTMDPSAGGQPNWSMLAAIVQTKGRPYFFKIVGPTSVVRAAKKPFDAMIDGLTPK